MVVVGHALHDVNLEDLPLARNLLPVACLAAVRVGDDLTLSLACVAVLLNLLDHAGAELSELDLFVCGWVNMSGFSSG